MTLHRHVQLGSGDRALFGDPVLHLLLVSVVVRQLVREDREDLKIRLRRDFTVPQAMIALTIDFRIHEIMIGYLETKPLRNFTFFK